MSFAASRLYVFALGASNLDVFALAASNLDVFAPRYARGWPWIWERYMDLIQPLATKLPWMVRAGEAKAGPARIAFRTQRARL